MERQGFLNLYVYSDSLAFRRKEQPQDLSFTYPFAVKSLIENELGIKTNVFIRGGGGLTIRQIGAILKRDTAYFGGDPAALNIAILQFGIVDCGPRPITYALAPILRKVPVVGGKLMQLLVKHRHGIQRFCSYRLTSTRDFKREYASIIAACQQAQIRPLSVGLPLPPFAIERRSPGFRRSAGIYNELIRDVIPESFFDVEKCMTEMLRERFLLADGHHLTEEGHRLYGQHLYVHLKKLL